MSMDDEFEFHRDARKLIRRGVEKGLSLERVKAILRFEADEAVAPPPAQAVATRQPPLTEEQTRAHNARNAVLRRTARNMTDLFSLTGLNEYPARDVLRFKSVSTQVCCQPDDPDYPRHQKLMNDVLAAIRSAAGKEPRQRRIITDFYDNPYFDPTLKADRNG